VETIKEASISERIIAKSITKRVTSNFAWSIVSEAIGRGVFFITNIYLARTLGVSNFGIFILAQTITYYFWLAVDLGTTMYGIREIAKDKENAEKIINPLLTLRITAGLVVFSLYSFSLFYFFEMPIINKLTFAGCGLYLLTYAFYTDWVFKGLEKFRWIAFGSLASSITFLSGIFYFVRSPESVTATSFVWSLSYVFGSLTLIVFLFKKLRIRYRPSFRWGLWFHHMRESIFFTISGSLMILYQYLPILLLSIFFTNYEVGLFSAPYKIITGLGSAGFLIPMAFYPVFSDLYYKDKMKFRKTHKKLQKIMLIVGIPIAIIGTIYGDMFVRFLFGDQYKQSVAVFKMLIWIVPMYFMRYSYGSVLLAAGFQRLHNIATLVGVLCMGIAGFFLIPQLSIKGGGLALLLSELSILGTMMIISYSTIINRKE